ncbi:MAG: hypothetical protein AB8H86_27755 [Polyangiales bacterium]
MLLLDPLEFSRRQLSILISIALLSGCGSTISDVDAGSEADASSLDASRPDVSMEDSSTPFDVVAQDVASDAREADVPSPDGFTLDPLSVEEVPPGLVPVAIALAHGRIITSCDHMQSVASDQTFSPDASDHHEHALKGAAFGNGVFVMSTGHGAPGHVLRSPDGLTWTQLSGESYRYADGSTGLLPGGTAGVIFDGTRFVLLRGRAPRMSSADGLEWREFGEELDRRYFHHRGHHYFSSTGRLFIEGENVDKSERWLLLSEDQGLTFREVDYDALCRVPQAHAHNTLITGGEMQVCTSFDEGETWNVEPAPENFGTILPTSEGFVGMRGYRRGLHRFDGESWNEEEVDRSMRFAAAARSPWGWYWLVSREEPHYWLSDDTHTFRSVASSSEGQVPRRFVFGYAAPSERCPLLEEG